MVITLKNKPKNLDNPKIQREWKTIEACIYGDQWMKPLNDKSKLIDRFRTMDLLCFNLKCAPGIIRICQNNKGDKLSRSVCYVIDFDKLQRRK